jgi:ADP-ribose pyrophosphatase YjhB (NUDIX family)
MKQLHEIQLQILKKLLFARSLRYHETKPDKEIENNQFQFHLDQLTEMGLVKKDVEGYSLTNKGKEYANRIDESENALKLQAKISVWVCCTRRFEGKLQFLIYTRLKQPFYGCQGYLCGKVRYGEKINGAAIRELKEETNLEGKDPKIVAIKHYRVFDKKSQELLEDKFMFLVLIENPEGELINNNEGKFEWVSEDKLMDYVANPFEDKKDFLHQIQLIKEYDGITRFFEEDCQSDKF